MKVAASFCAWSKAVLLLAGATLSWSAAAQQIVTGEAAAQRFVYQGLPMHPSCTAFPQDSAHTRPLVLAKCSASTTVPSTDAGGWVGVERKDRNGRKDGYRQYRVLANNGNRFLIDSRWSGGGTGHFNALLWVRLDEEQITVVEDLKAGDRCAGSPAGYVISGNGVDFAVDVTPALIIKLSGADVDESIARQLTSVAVSCNGSARYRYDLAAGKMQLLSLELKVSDRTVANAKAAQVCFEHLVLDHQQQGQMLLDPAALRIFGLSFAAQCAGQAAQASQSLPRNVVR